MNGLDLTASHNFSVGHFFGYDHPFFHINIELVGQTLLVITLITILSLIARFLVSYNEVARFIIISSIESLMDLTIQSLGYFSFDHFCFISALFLFIATCNIVPLIPGFDEPTRDLNTTLALAIISFVYIQRAAIKVSGMSSYIKNEFFSPFFLMLPLHVIGKIASIVSISFRLFGNIFGGSMITQIYFNTLKSSFLFQLIGLFSGINVVIMLFFTLFEGLLQAFVFTMLTLTYLAIALQNEEQ